MKSARVALLAAATAVLALASCRDVTSVAPRSVRESGNDLLGIVTTTVKSTGLLSCDKLPYATATATIGPMGGRIDVGPHSLVIPAGALSQPVTITATAPSDNVRRVHFEPHGLQFSRPASLTMSYAHCSLLGTLLPQHVAYVDDDLDILYLLNALDNTLQQTATSQLQHFSDYALAW